MTRLMLMFISLILILLLPILVQEAAGIRMVPERASKSKYFDHDGDSSDVMCKGTHRCLKSGRIRKLVTKPTTSKYEKNDDVGQGAAHFINDTTAGDKVETFPVHSTPIPFTNQHLHHHHFERFPDDVFDIAGMDYSPARRKPSIHN